MEAMAEKGAGRGAMRSSMPLVAAMVDELRHVLGADMVDAAMAKGMAAAREHAHVLATQGPAAAALWHRANAHRCTFVATEAGRTVGLGLPPSNPRPLIAPEPYNVPRPWRLPTVVYADKPAHGGASC